MSFNKKKVHQNNLKNHKLKFCERKILKRLAEKNLVIYIPSKIYQTLVVKQFTNKLLNTMKPSKSNIVKNLVILNLPQPFVLKHKLFLSRKNKYLKYKFLKFDLSF